MMSILSLEFEYDDSEPQTTERLTEIMAKAIISMEAAGASTRLYTVTMDRLEKPDP